MWPVFLETLSVLDPDISEPVLIWFPRSVSLLGIRIPVKMASKTEKSKEITGLEEKILSICSFIFHVENYGS